MRFVITAGPTREPIDPVRFLSNRSSGKMGFALAEAALESGHEVTIVAGPVSIAPPPAARLIRVETSEEMFEAVQAETPGCDVLIMAAAVADYRPRSVSPSKLKKQTAAYSLELEPTRDILRSLPAPRNFFVVGFAAETDDVEAKAQKKLTSKNCDMMIANDVSSRDSGMESDENEVTILFLNGERKRISRAPKKKIAQELVKIILNAREKSLTKKSW